MSRPDLDPHDVEAILADHYWAEEMRRALGPGRLPSSCGEAPGTGEGTGTLAVLAAYCVAIGCVALWPVGQALLRVLAAFYGAVPA